MGIQINGTTDNISANDGSWTATGLTNLTVTGIVTATSFSGDGASLTNVGGVGVGSSIFTSPGTFTIGTNCPSTITKIRIIASGGGGNGGGPSPGAPGSSGGGSSMVNEYYTTVSNGQIYNITVGGGGGATTITLPGPTPVASIPAGGNGPALGTNGGSAGTKDPASDIGIYLSANAGSAQAGGVGGLGGRSLFGNPGSPGNPATAGVGYGAGGAGGNGAAGAAGQPGIVIIQW